jgi:trigger factor
MIEAIRRQHPQSPPVDAEFIQKFGVADGSVETFRAEVKDNMTRALHHAIQSQLKQQVMDGLAALHDFDIPQSLVTEELRRLREESSRNTAGAAANLATERIATLATRRAKLRLILDEIVRQQGLRPDSTRVEARLQEMATTCTDPSALIDYYRSHPPMMQTIETAVLEEQIVDWVLEKAAVTDEPCDFDSVMNPPQ